MLPFFAWGANTSALSVAAAIVHLGWAAFALALLPSTTPQVLRMAPALLPLALLLAWAALPLWPQWSAGLVAPAIAPDLVPIAWCHACSLVAVLAACGTAGRLRGFVPVTLTWLCLLAGLLMATTLALRAVDGPAFLTGLVVEQGYHRFAGLLGNANAAGVSYGMFSLLMRGIALDRWHVWRKRVTQQLPLGTLSAVLGTIIALALVALSQSRTALAATVVAHAVYGLSVGRAGREPRTPHGHRVIAVVALVVAGLATWGFAGMVLDRYRVVQGDGLGRLAVLRYYSKLASEAPAAGYGLGAFDTVNQRHLTPDSVLLVGDFGAAHNAVLQLVIEVGWVGLALVALALIAIGWHLTSPRSVATPSAHAMRRGMLLAVAVAGAASMIDIALNVPAIATLSVALLGLVWGQSLGGAARTSDAARIPAQATPWSTDAMRNSYATPAGESPSSRSIAGR